MPGRSPNRFPLGLIGMLTLSIAVESLVAAHDLAIVPLIAWSYRFAARAAHGQATDSDLLILGDSQAKFGLDPVAIEAGSGLRAYNLAIIGAQPPATYFVLRQALDAGARPAAIVVNFKPSALSGDPRKNADHLPELATPRDCWDLALATRDPDHFARLMTARALPTLRSRFELRALLRNALQDKSPPTPAAMHIALESWRLDRGGHLLPTGSPFDGQVPPADHPIYFPDRWAVRPIQADYIHRLLDLAASRQIRVYWLLAPIAPSAQSRRESLGLDARHESFVRSLAPLYPHLTILDARHSPHPPYHFVDPCHLNRLGALSLSTDLASALARDLRSPSPGLSWVRLPVGPASPPLRVADRSLTP